MLTQQLREAGGVEGVGPVDADESAPVDAHDDVRRLLPGVRLAMNRDPVLRLSCPHVPPRSL